MPNKLPTIELSGSPHQRGEAHGEAFRDVIRGILDEYIEDLLQSSPTRPHWFTRQGCRAWAREHVPYIRDYAPDLHAEAEGIAEGANVSLEEVILLNAFLAIADWLSPTFHERRSAQIRGCTSFGVSGEDGEGHAIIGQNYDLESLYQRGAILLRIKDKNGPDSLVVTIAGIVGGAGINAAGIAVVINNLIPSDSRPGVLYPFLIRRLLQARDPGTAIDAITSARRASGTSYTIADSSGVIVALETSATDYAVIRARGGRIAHANHYVSGEMQKYEARWTMARGQSIFRDARMDYLLHQEKPHSGVERFMQILADHANHPIGICRHDEPHGTCGKTICGMIFLPHERRAYVSAGNPCESRFVEYEA